MMKHYIGAVASFIWLVVQAGKDGSEIQVGATIMIFLFGAFNLVMIDKYRNGWEWNDWTS